MTPLERRLKHSRRCRNCTSTIPPLASVAADLRTAVPTRLASARAKYVDAMGFEYAHAIGALEEWLPTLAARVLGFCDRVCEKRHTERVEEARADT